MFVKHFVIDHCFEKRYLKKILTLLLPTEDQKWKCYITINVALN